VSPPAGKIALPMRDFRRDVKKVVGGDRELLFAAFPERAAGDQEMELRVGVVHLAEEARAWRASKTTSPQSGMGTRFGLVFKSSDRSGMG